MRITGKNEWGHRDLNPDPRISLVSVLQLVIILFPQSAHFLQRQLESQMIARLHYDPILQIHHMSVVLNSFKAKGEI